MTQDLRALIERVEGLTEAIDRGAGISWSMGEDHVRRYDPETGKPYSHSRPANLTASSRKMRAIIDAYELLPSILATLRAIEASK